MVQTVVVPSAIIFEMPTTELKAIMPLYVRTCIDLYIKEAQQQYIYKVRANISTLSCHNTPHDVQLITWQLKVQIRSHLMYTQPHQTAEEVRKEGMLTAKAQGTGESGSVASAKSFAAATHPFPLNCSMHNFCTTAN